MSVSSVSAPGAYPALNVPANLPQFSVVGSSQSVMPPSAPAVGSGFNIDAQPATIQAGIAHMKEGPTASAMGPRYEGDPSSSLLVITNNDKEKGSKNKISPALKATIGVDLAVMSFFLLSPFLELLPRHMRRNIEDTPGTLALVRKNLGAQKRGAADAKGVMEKAKKEHEEQSFRNDMLKQNNQILNLNAQYKDQAEATKKQVQTLSEKITEISRI